MLSVSGEMHKGRYAVKIGRVTCWLSHRPFRLLMKSIIATLEHGPVSWREVEGDRETFARQLHLLRCQLREYGSDNHLLIPQGDGMFKLIYSPSEIKLKLDALLDVVDEDLKLDLLRLANLRVLK